MIEGRVVGELESNCYLFICDETKKAAIIDPGGDGVMIYHWVLEKGVKVEYILLTHGHIDHIAAVDELKQLLGAKVAIHTADAEMLTNPKYNQSIYIGFPLAFEPADILLNDGDVITVGKETLTVISTPGHSLGGVCFLTREGLFCGDTLFSGSIGRTDLRGGSEKQLLSSVRKRLFVLPAATRVFPGHMEETTIARELAFNPFFY